MFQPEIIESLNDTRIQPYRNLKFSNLTRWSGFFVVEGLTLVRQLIQSDYQAVSVLGTSKALESVSPQLGESDTAVYLMEESAIGQLVGFNFHRGILACGQRKPTRTIDELLKDDTRLVVVCPKILDPTNLGSLIRSCLGFEVDLMMLGPGCADPLSRRVIRVSVGAALDLPILQPSDLSTALSQLRESGFQIVSSTLNSSAIPLPDFRPQPRLAILFGNEADGLSSDWIDCSDLQLTIPHSERLDSLNLSVAGGIILHHCRSRLPVRT